MNTDFRIATNFKTNRKRLKLQRKLGPEGVLSLLDLWGAVATLQALVHHCFCKFQSA